MDWKQLKQFCDTLSEEQLNKNVILWREDEAISNIDAEIIQQDQYIGEGDEGCYPLDEAGLTLEDVKKNGLRKVYSAGDPILAEIF